jgi:hypothetical protein
MCLRRAPEKGAALEKAARRDIAKKKQKNVQMSSTD